MNANQVQMVRTSFEFFRPCGASLVASALRRAADDNDGLQRLLPEDLSGVSREWFATLGQAVKHCDRFSVLERALGELGGRASAAGVSPAQYNVVRQALLASMEELAGEDWTPQLRRAWGILLDAITGAMLAGALGGRAAA